MFHVQKLNVISFIFFFLYSIHTKFTAFALHILCPTSVVYNFFLNTEISNEKI